MHEDAPPRRDELAVQVVVDSLPSTGGTVVALRSPVQLLVQFLGNLPYLTARLAPPRRIGSDDFRKRPDGFRAARGTRSGSLWRFVLHWLHRCTLASTATGDCHPWPHRWQAKSRTNDGSNLTLPDAAPLCGSLMKRFVSEEASVVMQPPKRRNVPLVRLLSELGRNVRKVP
jgi:hypothetical protein